MEAELHLKRKLGLWTAVFAVFASMIGSGIFGTSGHVLALVNDPTLTIGLWVFYGLTALAGALCYAELAAELPHPGGEYVYIRHVFGKLPAFLTGWVSFMVGFAAPAAASAFLAGDYTLELLKIVAPDAAFTALFATSSGQKIFAISIIILFSIVHSLEIEKGSAIQNALTMLKLLIIFIFLAAGFGVALNGVSVTPAEYQLEGSPDWKGMGLGMLLVLYAYSGWNGASYLAGEVKNPEKNVPRALFWGTLLTTIIYILINLLYFLVIPAAELLGQQTPAAMTVERLYGSGISTAFNAAFAIILLSSVSAQIMIGPRVYYAMARDGNFFKYAGVINKKFHTPVTSIFLQGGLSIIYVLTGTFYTVLIYMGFALSIFPVVTMLALMKLRKTQAKDKTIKKGPQLYKTPFYPLLPIFFILVSIYLMVFSFIQNWKSCMFAVTVVLLGIPVYYGWQKYKSPAVN